MTIFEGALLAILAANLILTLRLTALVGAVAIKTDGMHDRLMIGARNEGLRDGHEQGVEDEQTRQQINRGSSLISLKDEARAMLKEEAALGKREP